MRANLVRRLQWLGAVAIMLAALAGASTGGYYGWHALRHAQRTCVNHIEVSGARRAGQKELLAYANVKLGDSILDVNLDDMALRLRRHPWVREAIVGRHWPDRVTIQVIENEPAVLVALSEVYVADGQGRLFKRLAPGDKLSLPVITGLDREEAARKRDATAAKVRQALSLLAAFASASPVLGNLSELHWDADLGWSVVTDAGPGPCEGGTRLVLGFEPEQRLSAAAHAAARARSRGMCPAMIWADGTERPGQIPIRLTTAAAKLGGQTLAALSR